MTLSLKTALAGISSKLFGFAKAGQRDAARALLRPGAPVSSSSDEFIDVLERHVASLVNELESSASSSGRATKLVYDEIPSVETALPLQTFERPTLIADLGVKTEAWLDGHFLLVKVSGVYGRVSLTTPVESEGTWYRLPAPMATPWPFDHAK